MEQKLRWYKRVVPFLKDVRAELRKVTWPTPEQARNLTILVLIVSAAVGVYISLFDLVFTELVRVMTTI